MIRLGNMFYKLLIELSKNYLSLLPDRSLLDGGLAAAVQDVDDDGCADQGGNAVDGHGTLEARGAGNQITD